jgi:hypothetical protein
VLHTRLLLLVVLGGHIDQPTPQGHRPHPSPAAFMAAFQRTEAEGNYY